MVDVEFFSIVTRGNENVGTVSSPLSPADGLGRSILSVRLSGVSSSRTLPDHINALAKDLHAGCNQSKLSYACGVQKRR